jgi:hypothetical protein
MLLSVLTSSVAFSADASGSLHEGHSSSAAALQDAPSACADKGHSPALGFESVQIETSDLARFEQFFTILKVPLVEQHEHPGRDRLRGYCYREVSIVVRQDMQTPRPTGWVQINFSVPDVAVVQEELERLYKESTVAKLEEVERNSIIRFRLKPDVKRGDRKAVRLEVSGPDGFMIGFNQYK